MNELLHEAISMHNLPVTVLLGLVLAYWLLVIIGIMDADDHGIDLDGDGHADFGDHSAEGGFWLSAGRFLHLGVVPFMIVLSVLALTMWFISVIANYYLNGVPGDRSSTVALMLLVPNLLVSALITRVIVTPLKNLFASLQERQAEEVRILGREGVVISSQVDSTYGQVEVPTDGAPLLLNVRAGKDQPPIPRGTSVIIYESADDGAYHLVRPISLPSQVEQA